MLRKAMFASTAVCLGLAAVTVSIIPESALADSLIAEGIDPADASQTPNRGIDKSTVASDLGDPINQMEPVGEPPISSWEYSDFVVFFENDKVLHTVAKR